MSQNPVGRDFSPVELFDSPYLPGPETGEVAVNAMDVSDLQLCGTKCRGIGFRVQGPGYVWVRMVRLVRPVVSFFPPVPGPLYP